jgi:hypothetical protein
VMKQQIHNAELWWASSLFVARTVIESGGGVADATNALVELALDPPANARSEFVEPFGARQSVVFVAAFQWFAMAHHRSTHRSWGTKTPTTATSAGSCPRRLEMVRMHLRHDAKITLMMLPVVALILLLVWLFG